MGEDCTPPTLKDPDIDIICEQAKILFLLWYVFRLFFSVLLYVLMYVLMYLPVRVRMYVLCIGISIKRLSLPVSRHVL